MTQNWMETMIAWPGRLLMRLLSTRLLQAIVANDLYVLLVLVSIVVFCSFPSYDVALVLHEMDTNWECLFLQSKEPFVDHSQLYDPESHCSKLAFRFVPALLLRLFSITTIQGGLILQLIILVAFYAVLHKVLKDLFKDRNKAFACALPICFVMAGHVYVSDYRGIFDTLALALLLTALLARRTPWALIPLLLAYFTDERALLASAGCMMLYLFLAGRTLTLRSMLQGAFTGSSGIVVLSWALYAVGRYCLVTILGLHTAPVDMLYYFVQNSALLFYGFYVGLEGFLILMVVVVAYLFRTRSYAFLIALVASFMLIYVVAMSVIDINRSMAYVLIVLLLLMVVLDRIRTTVKFYDLIAWTTLVCLVFDDFMPLAAQLYRMKFITHTI